MEYTDTGDFLYPGAAAPCSGDQVCDGEGDEGSILSMWLLTSQDVKDAVHTPPKELAQILRERARENPKLIQHRLRHLRPDLVDCETRLSTSALCYFTVSQKVYQQHFGYKPFVVGSSHFSRTRVSLTKPTELMGHTDDRLLAEGDYTSGLPEPLDMGLLEIQIK